MEEVPGPFRKAWSSALSSVIRRLLLSKSDEEVDRYLKWFFALPKLLLREPKRGGKGKGTGEVSARFSALQEENWGLLLQLLLWDEEADKR